MAEFCTCHTLLTWFNKGWHKGRLLDKHSYRHGIGPARKRFKPPPHVVRRPSRAARAKRRGRRFGIPTPPPSPVHMSRTSSPSVSDQPASDLDLDLESAKKSLPLDQLQEHLHPLYQAGADDPTFPVPISLAISQVRRLAHLSQSAVHSGQAMLVYEGGFLLAAM